MSLDPSRPSTDRTTELSLEPPAPVAADQVEHACRLVESTGDTRRIWFRFPAGSAPLLTQRADPFVIATLPYLLGRCRRLVIRGAVSQGLVANLADFQSAYLAFHNRRAPLVQLEAPVIAPPAGAGRSDGGITAFSGGVDSCFSVWRHTGLSRLEPKRPLRAALMMHGFDIPLGETAEFERAAQRARALADTAGVRLHTGATNLRTLPGEWEDTFGTAVAAALSFFQSAFSFGLIPSAQQWRQAHFDHGSNPLTDPLLSSAAFAIVHDGTHFGRIEKLRELTQWPAALAGMRVCWEGRHLDANCGRCEKCLRTMLMLRLCGTSEPAAFPPLDVTALETLTIRTRGGLDEFAYLLDEARRLGVTESWVPAAARALRRGQRRLWLQTRARSVAGLLPAGWRESLRHQRYRRHRRATAASTATDPVDAPKPAAEAPARH